MSERIAIFYGSSTCYTEMTAEKLRDRITPQPDVFNVSEHPVELMEDYDLILVGIPTWDYGELQEDWEEVWEDLNSLDLSNTCVAIWGQGDQIGYPQWFQDAVGYLHDVLQSRRATLLGYWPNEGYEFEESQALSDDGKMFLGLALDDENQFDASSQRIDTWLKQVMTEFSQLKG